MNKLAYLEGYLNKVADDKLTAKKAADDKLAAKSEKQLYDKDNRFSRYSVDMRPVAKRSIARGADPKKVNKLLKEQHKLNVDRNSQYSSDNVLSNPFTGK